MGWFINKKNLILLLLVLTIFVPVGRATAFQFSERSLTLLDSKTSASTNHTYRFTLKTAAPLGSIKIQYCDDPFFALPCTAPTGLDVSAANLNTQSGETGFSILNATSNEIILTRPLGPSNAIPVQYEFSNAINPSNRETFFVRISTYQTIDATGPYTDYGAVVSATTQGVGITTEVPPTLQFCVGVSIPSDCSSASGYLLQLGDLSANRTSVASSQMMGGTNADFGYIITATGGSMASGTNVISPLSTPTASQVGVGQFGINLRQNSSPAVGSDRTGTGIAVPAADYNNPNLFKYVSGDIVARSTDETNNVKFTVSYIVNIPRGQQPGIYSSTVTYLCVATF